MMADPRAPHTPRSPTHPNAAPVSDSGHIPVLLEPVLRMLAPQDGELHVDATFGRGGYTTALLHRADCRVIALDRDPEAVAAGQALAQQWDGRLQICHARFGDMDSALDSVLGTDVGGRPTVDGVALDLGVSSPQLDDPARGFSFRHDGPLDMRMGAEGPSAADVVNGASQAELADILHFLGEERHARRVARAIVEARAGGPIETTGTLADIVRRVVPRAKDGIDPATRTFQGLRLHVNDEMGELRRGLSAAERVLAPGGRLAVVSFHSLEDRQVKRFLQTRSGRAGAGSRHLPVAPAEARRAPSFTLLTRKPLEPSETDVAANPRARSAKLRAARRTDAPAWPEGSEDREAA